MASERTQQSVKSSSSAKKSASPAKQKTRVAEPDFIEVRGAREHNLDVPHLLIPKRQLVVFTGVSGSGKSSLAFDTLYAEGQRRYVESLSSYARQFLGQLERPQVEQLRGLSPTIAIEQKSASSNPRSTVGTITEIYDYMRVFWARLGVQHCSSCGKPVQSQSAEQIVNEIMALPEGSAALVAAPIARERKGEFRDVFDEYRARGFVRMIVDGEVARLDALTSLDKKKKHTVSLLVDRVTVKASERQRLTDSVESALVEGKGELEVSIGAPGKQTRLFSQARTCCGQAFPELSPANFSFNGPLGMCSGCNGLGFTLEPDPALVVPDASLSIRQGAIAPWSSAMERGEGWTFRIVDALAKEHGVSLDTPFEKLPKKVQTLVLHGSSDTKKLSVSWGSQKSGSHGTFGVSYEGVIPGMLRRYRETTSELSREHALRYMTECVCEGCSGRRLRAESLSVLVGGKSIADVTAMTVSGAASFFAKLKLEGARQLIAEGVLREINARLGFLLNVGLDYLTIERSGPTLSGGEAQRIRLASQLGSELSGVMYVLDEPSIGLHQRDNQRLISTLERLRDLGNTVVVVEHDEDTIRASDFVVDFGPGAGTTGGKVLFAGTPEDLVASPDSITGGYLSGRLAIASPTVRRAPRGHLEVLGATEHNLKNIDVRIPLGVFCAVTGVSGAGKSSLINGILLPALSKSLHGSTGRIGTHRKIKGIEAIDKCIAIDQQPIGRMPRSNPGTYTKAFDLMREVFAQLPDARAKGFEPGRFSFNVKGGRCEGCGGGGVVKVEMHFLADVYVTCEECAGKRYNAQTLSVRYRGHSIADVLAMSIDQCATVFESHPQLMRVLQTLQDVGLGYMSLGQTAPTMSGGEAQRVKLSRELAKTQSGRTLYILDEPTTGLHFEDIRRLLHVLQKLVDAGNTVIVIEHNLDMIRCADWIIDIGPEGGAGGGLVIAEGTPEEVAKSNASHTGRFLRPLLKGSKAVVATEPTAAPPVSRKRMKSS